MAAEKMCAFRAYLNPEQLDALRGLAKRRNVSIGVLVREGVDRLLADVPPEEDPPTEIIRTFDSGPGNAVEDQDE